jgi:small ligand-binding sensory domain FIST
MDVGDIRAAHAAGPDWRAAADACLADLAREPGPADQAKRANLANLGFVYATDAFAPHFSAIAAYLRDATGIAHWVGSVGLGICATGIEYFDEPALCLLTGAFPDDAFRVFPAVVDDLRAFEAGYGAWCDATGARFAMVHADPHNGGTEALARALCERMEGGFLVGGLTSSRGAHPQLADVVTDGGISGVVFAPQVSVVTRLTQGCAPLGPRHAITACRGNVLMELDGRPALDVFYADIGESLAADPARLGSLVFAGLPVKGSDTGDYLVRNLAGIDEDDRLVAIAERVQTGDAVMFCRRDRKAAEQDMRRMLEEIGGALDGPPAGGVYYSCLARGPNLLGGDSEELKLIEDALGSFPLVGFFGNGEISHNRLYGYTGVLTLFV